MSWRLHGLRIPNATRLAAVKAAGLEYLTDKNQSYAANLKNAGNTSISKFATLKAAIQQLISLEEGSAWGISNEVGTAKIANPFQAGDISYVESPYSYNSITDFRTTSVLSRTCGMVELMVQVLKLSIASISSSRIMHLQKVSV